MPDRPRDFRDDCTVALAIRCMELEHDLADAEDERDQLKKLVKKIRKIADRDRLRAERDELLKKWTSVPDEYADMGEFLDALKDMMFNSNKDFEKIMDERDRLLVDRDRLAAVVEWVSYPPRGETMTIEKLTPNQQKQIAEYRDRYWRMATSTEPADRARAEAAARRLAEIGGVAVRDVRWVWLAYYTYAVEAPGIKCSDEHRELLRLHNEIAASCFALWIAPPGQVILCERPAAVEIVDGQLAGITWRSEFDRTTDGGDDGTDTD